MRVVHFVSIDESLITNQIPTTYWNVGNVKTRINDFVKKIHLFKSNILH